MAQTQNQGAEKERPPHERPYANPTSRAYKAWLVQKNRKRRNEEEEGG